MKKFLKDLEKELSKFKFGKKEIEEILADHKEMIDQALNDGLTEEQITEKFGNPEKLASDLYTDLSAEKSASEQQINTDEQEEIPGFNLYKTLNVVEELKEVSIKVISEDIAVYPYTGEQIQVYFKNVKEPELYSITLNGGVFSFGREVKKSFNIFRSSNEQVIIKLPETKGLEKYTLTSVSGDAELKAVNAKHVALKSTSGDFEILGLKAGKGELTTVSGDYEIKGMKADELFVSSVSGDFEIENVVVKNDVTLNTVSGDFEVFNFVAETASLKTVSGDLDAKEFYVSKIDLRSVSGDIEIENRDKTRPIEVGKKRSVSGDIKIR